MLPIRSSPAWIFALFAGLAGFAIGCVSPAIFNDGDTFWHIAAGQWMLAHGAILKSDVFSFTFTGRFWDTQEWLSEVIMTLAYGADGWSGIHILFGLAAGITAAVVAYRVRTQTATLLALAVSVVGLACILPSLLARPHVLALPFLAIWTFALLQARDQKRAPSWWLWLVMLAWVNLHGSFAFGLALAGAFALEAMIEDRAAWKGWGIFLVGAVIAAVIKPHGIEGLIFPIKLLMMGSTRTITEWKPTSLTQPTPYLAALAMLVLLGITGRLELGWLRRLLLLGLVWLALSHVRHQMIFGIVGAMLVAEGLRRSTPPEERAYPDWLAPLGAVLLAIILVVRAVIPTARADNYVTPKTALEKVPVALRNQPVLNGYDFGGYLIFSGVKVFVDGRTDMYGDAFLADYDRIMRDRRALKDALERWHITWTIMRPSTAAWMMDAMPGWHRAYADQFAVVDVKD